MSNAKISIQETSVVKCCCSPSFRLRKWYFRPLKSAISNVSEMYFACNSRKSQFLLSFTQYRLHFLSFFINSSQYFAIFLFVFLFVWFDSPTFIPTALLSIELVPYFSELGFPSFHLSAGFYFFLCFILLYNLIYAFYLRHPCFVFATWAVQSHYRKDLINYGICNFSPFWLYLIFLHPILSCLVTFVFFLNKQAAKKYVSAGLG